MPQGFDDVVRAYQLPTSAPSQLYLSQYNLASNTPIYITPGFGGQGSGQFPPINTWTTHYDFTETFYCAAASSEKGGEEGGGAGAGGGDGGAPSRHVKRVFQMDADGQPNPDVYVDVLRHNKLAMNFQTSSSGQAGLRINYKLKWNDDPNNPDNSVDDSGKDAQQENANAGRKTKQLAIKDPENPDDPTGEVKLWIVEKLKVSFGAEDTGKLGQRIQFVFHNDKEGQGVAGG
jgi:hypothetical protein